MQDDNYKQCLFQIHHLFALTICFYSHVPMVLFQKFTSDFLQSSLRTLLAPLAVQYVWAREEESSPSPCFPCRSASCRGQTASLGGIAVWGGLSHVANARGPFSAQPYLSGSQGANVYVFSKENQIKIILSKIKSVGGNTWGALQGWNWKMNYKHKILRLLHNQTGQILSPIVGWGEKITFENPIH